MSLGAAAAAAAGWPSRCLCCRRPGAARTSRALLLPPRRQPQARCGLPPRAPPPRQRLAHRPSLPPADLYDNYYGKKPSVKLYVRRVFISDSFEDLLPK